MSTEYHKIQTVWARDPGTKHRTLIEGQWTTPEFGMLANTRWVFTEKVDGTNIRVLFDPQAHPILEFRGRTDRAQLPPKLLEALRGLFTLDSLGRVFDGPVCLYGEGYGSGIQKAGASYRPDQSFVLFDVSLNGVVLERENVCSGGVQLGVEVVPEVGVGTLYEMINRVRLGHRSVWGDFPAEGIVARPEFELRDRLGNRIITKVKAKDFPK